MIKLESILFIFLGRLLGLTCISSAIEGVITGHIPYNSWKEPVLILIGSISWTIGDICSPSCKNDNS